jgi:hypothetical protein
MDRVKATAIAEAEAALERARAAVAELAATTAGQLWLKDLADFESAWEKMLATRAAAAKPLPARAKYTKPKKIAAST